MTTCEEFEIAIERRLHGALEEPAGRALGAHLSHCESCRAFEGMARRTEGAMTATANEALQGIDWSKVEAGIRLRRRDLRSGLLAAVITSAALVALLSWGIPPPAGRAAYALSLAWKLGAICATYLILASVSAWRLARTTARGELLELHRRMLRLRVRTVSLLRWVVFALPLISLRHFFVPQPPKRLAVYLTLSAFLVLFALYAQFVALPRARREQAELDPERRS